MNMKLNFFLFLSILCIFCHCNNAEKRGKLASEGDAAGNLIDSVYRLCKMADSTRVINNVLSKSMANKAMKLASGINTPKALAMAYRALGMACFDHQDDSAFVFLNRALRIADSANLPEIKRAAMFNLARLNSRIYNYRQALILLDSVINDSRVHDDYISLSNAYNSRGVVYADLRDSVNARKSFEMAYAIAEKHQLYSQQGSALANLAIKETDANRAIELYRRAILLLRRSFHADNNEEIGSITINIGIKHPNTDSAIAYLKEGLDIARTGNFPLLEAVSYNIMAYKYLDKKDPGTAEKCVTEHMIPLIPKLKNPELISMVYDTYADVLAFSGKFKDAFKNQKIAFNAKSRSESEKVTGDVLLLAGMLELKNKESTISEKEIALQRQELALRQMRFWLLTAILAIVISISFMVWFRTRTKMKIQHEKLKSARMILEIEEKEKNRLARELHDTVGHLIQIITTRFSGRNDQEWKDSHDISIRMQELGEIIRNISHRMNSGMVEKFTMEELLTGLCEDFRSLTGIKLDYRIPAFSHPFSFEIKLHVSRILQELLTNGSKYAPDAQILISFALVDEKLLFHYHDDGPGFETGSAREHSMGILNIRERVTLLEGEFKLQSLPGKGTIWDFTIPLT